VIAESDRGEGKSPINAIAPLPFLIGQSQISVGLNHAPRENRVAGFIFISPGLERAEP
jgi:hypothetical protein